LSDGYVEQTPAATVNFFHAQSDVDSAPFAQHHSLGQSANQAAAGNHTHPQNFLVGSGNPNTNNVDPLIYSIYFDSSDGNAMWYSTGTSWVTSADSATRATAGAALTAAGNAQTTANGKNTAFYQGTAPSTSGRIDGDLWFDTSNNYRLSVFQSGAWVVSLLGNNAIATSGIDAGKITVGLLSAAVIGARTITADKLLIGGTTGNMMEDSGFEDSAAVGRILTGSTSGPYRDTSAGATRSGVAGLTVPMASFATNGIIYLVSNGVGALGSIPAGKAFAVGTGEQVTIVGYAKAIFSPSATMRITAIGYDSTGAVAVAEVGTAVDLTAAGYGSYTKFTATITVPAGVVYLAPIIKKVTADGTVTYWCFDDITVTRSITGSLIVDGAIDGKVITGPTIQSAVSGSRIVIKDFGANDYIYIYPTGSAYESPGRIAGGTSPATGGADVVRILWLESPYRYNGLIPIDERSAKFALLSESDGTDKSTIMLYADKIKWTAVRTANIIDFTAGRLDIKNMTTIGNIALGSGAVITGNGTGAKATANVGSITTSEVTLATVSSYVVNDASTKIKVSFSWFGFASTVSGDVFEIRLKRGSTIIAISRLRLGSTAVHEGSSVFTFETPGSGTYTYTAVAIRISGTGTGTLSAGSTSPATLTVEGF